MQAHELLVVQEQAELAEKLEKLSVFISASPHFTSLPDEDKTLLRRQREIMLEYHEVLGDRIGRF